MDCVFIGDYFFSSLKNAEVDGIIVQVQLI